MFREGIRWSKYGSASNAMKSEKDSRVMHNKVSNIKEQKESKGVLVYFKYDFG